MESDPHERMMRAIGAWQARLEAVPGWAAWRKRRFRAVLSYGDDDPPQAEREEPAGFLFDVELEAQHAAVMAYLALSSTWHALADTEYYFRRYPFRGLPVTKEAHIRYMCEVYFSRIYELRERLKVCLNAVNRAITPDRLDAGALIKAFDKEFDQEIRERHGVHHRERFDDVAIEQLSIMGAIAGSRNDRGWGAEHRRAYGRTQREWAERVQRRAGTAAGFRDAAAVAMLERCGFLGVDG